MQNIGKFGLDWAGKITDQNTNIEYEMLIIILFNNNDKEIDKKTYYVSPDMKSKLSHLPKNKEAQIQNIWMLKEYTKII